MDGTTPGYRCPYCGTGDPPAVHSRISSAGWVFFWLLFIFLCWPLCWIGLLIKDHYRVCGGCGMTLGPAITPAAAGGGWFDWKDLRLALIITAALLPLIGGAVYIWYKASR